MIDFDYAFGILTGGPCLVCRRGAINAKQLSFLESYKRKSKKDCAIQ